MITRHSKIVDYYLRSFTVPAAYPGGKQDLRQVGLLGLVKANQTWDRSKSSFQVWAWYWIRSFIRDEIKKYKPIERRFDILYYSESHPDQTIFLNDVTHEFNGKDRELLGRFCCGQNTTEIGKSWSISRQAVDQRLARVLGKLKKELAYDKLQDAKRIRVLRDSPKETRVDSEGTD